MNTFRILVVDDNYSKVELVGQVIKDNLDCEIEYSNTTNEALKKIRDSAYDLVVVDMNLPQIIGDSPSLGNGTELIENIFRNNKVNKPFCVIGATSHSSAYQENIAKLSKFGIPLVLTDEKNNELKSLLSNKIAYYQQVKEKINETSKNGENVEVCYPDKVTLNWLVKHVDWKHWVGALVFLVGAFSFGVKSSGTTLIKEIYGISSDKAEAKQEQKSSVITNDD